MIGTLTVLAALTSGAATRLVCPFTFGFPEGTELIDADGLTPSNTAAKQGFAPGSAWIITDIDSGADRVAASTSWYSPKGTSDDRMILPAVEIQASSALTWRAKASDAKHPDGYKVMIGREGAGWESYSEIFEVKSETADWTTHTLQLGEYDGENMRVAFVNNSTNQAFLYIDDIKIAAPETLLIESTTAVVAAPGENVTLSGIVSTDTEMAFPVVVECQGQTLTLTAAGSFELPQPVTLEKEGDQLPITLTARDANGITATVSDIIRCIPRRHLLEEFTGTWCGYCVRGIVAMEAMREKYPDSFVGVAVHHGDVMAFDGTTNSYVLCTKGGHYPNSILDRKYEDDLSSLEDTFLKAVSEAGPTRGALTLKVDLTSGNELTATTQVWFNQSEPNANARLVYMITEDNVHHPGDPAYDQKNAYCGGHKGEMGGYEKYPDPESGDGWSSVPSDDMWYQCVLRHISGGTLGLEDALPSAVERGKCYTHTYTITLPENIDNRENIRVIAALLEDSGKRVINVSQVDASNFNTEGAIETVPASEALQSPVVAVRWFDVSGRSLSGRPDSGLAIAVECHADGTTTVRKVLIK